MTRAVRHPLSILCTQDKETDTYPTVEAKDAAAEAVGADGQKAKAKAAELKGEAKGKAEELKGQANAAKEEAKAKI